MCDPETVERHDDVPRETPSDPDPWAGLADRLGYTVAPGGTWGMDYNAGGPRCPLPTVRHLHDADGMSLYGDDDKPVYGVEPCGAVLAMEVVWSESLDGNGLGYMVPSSTLRCIGGHVLLVCDVEDDGPDLTPALVETALARLLPPEAPRPGRPTLGGRVEGTGYWTVDDLAPPDGVSVVTMADPPRPALRDPDGGAWCSWMALPALAGLREQLSVGAKRLGHGHGDAASASNAAVNLEGDVDG